MPEVRLLVPLTDPDGNEHKVDEVIDVDVETAEAWRHLGKVSLITAELAQMEQAGHYTDVTGREDVAPLEPATRTPGPQSDDEPPPRPVQRRR